MCEPKQVLFREGGREKGGGREGGGREGEREEARDEGREGRRVVDTRGY